MTWADLLARPRPAPDRTFRYGPDPYQIVDLWRPAGPGPHPVVLMIHGGCWTTSIADRTLMNWAAADLRAREIAVWNIDYRGVDRQGRSPGITFVDVVGASQLLKSYSTVEKLDLSRVVAVGHSAGGHLALWLASHPVVLDRSRNSISHTPPSALALAHVVSLGGLPDLEQSYVEKQGCGREPIAALVASAADREKLNDPVERQKLMSGKSVPPIGPLNVPQTLINGDADKIIPTHFATDYAAKMRTAGDEVTVTIVPNQGHVELIAPGTPAWAAAVRAIEGALGR